MKVGHMEIMGEAFLIRIVNHGYDFDLVKNEIIKDILTESISQCIIHYHIERLCQY